MPGKPLRFVASLMAMLMAIPVSTWPTASDQPNDSPKRAAHALNRLAFGPRPGDFDRVQKMGVDQWIEQQLHPENIDDSAIQARLAPYRTLNMSAHDMIETYPPPQVLKKIAEGKQSLPKDPVKRAIYETQLEAYKAKQERKAAGDNDPQQPAKSQDPAVESFFADMDAGSGRKQAKQDADALAKMSPDDRFAAILKMSAQERRATVQGLSPEEREKLAQGFSMEQREELQAMARLQQVIINELAGAKVLRAVYSERQLEEVMTDFWFNHFNVYFNKSADRYLTTSYERDVIRKHAFGKFEDLLIATATSPAMLFYLDNFQSVGPDSPAGKGEMRRGRFAPQANKQNQPKRGLNENYARELMELHTLGVDGGYTQQDVTEVAKVFTGWTVRQPRMGGGYEFRPQLHEPGNKKVLGKTIRSDGENEGREVLHMLATAPATAKFISKKLAMRFVADDPPPALVDRMAATFTKSHGDIREVLRTLFKSPEFWAPEAYRAKVKTPFEFVVSALRGTGSDVDDPRQILQTLNQMGEPLYAMQPPTGYSMKAETWVNSAALINRMNFSLALSAGRVRGVNMPAPELGTTNGTAALTALSQSLLAGDISAKTEETVKKQMGDPKTSTPAMIAGLLLGSPEFQRR